MRRGIAIFGAVLVVLLFALAAELAWTSGHGQPGGTARPALSPAVPVLAATVKIGDVPIYLRGLGTVIAYNTVIVRSQIQGPITQISFKEGQTVHKGDLLAQIDPAPYQAQLDQMTATRDRDQGQLTNALADLDRYTTLQVKGWATQQLVDTQKAQVTQLQGAVKADEALIDAAKVQLGYTKLTSPIEGITGVRQVDVGNIIHPTDANGLVVVTQVEPISVIFTLPQTDLPVIQQQMAKGQLSVLAYSQDNKIKLDEGKLVLINNEILQTTGTVQLKADFLNTAHLLWPGELINVRLLLETRQNALTIASSALQQGPQGSYVYVIEPDNKVQMRSVSATDLGDERTLIASGLRANENVVIEGQYRLEPGSVVQELHGEAAKAANLQSSVEQAIP
jgi:multidrug efflux system membrane fusion protein